MNRTVSGDAGAAITRPDAGRRDPEYPMTVREAAQFLGVSPQTVYLWVELRHIPHLRVMGRNIRFLKSDLEKFRASFNVTRSHCRLASRHYIGRGKLAYKVFLS